MDLFQQMVEMGHERVLFCSNPDVGLRGHHRRPLDRARPGARRSAGCGPTAARRRRSTDVLRLSRGMTYKAAAAGLNLGGGKAVIIGDAKKDKSEALLRAFGRYVESLGGLYITAEDVGTDMDDMEVIHHETRWVTGVLPGLGRRRRSLAGDRLRRPPGDEGRRPSTVRGRLAQGPLGRHPGARQRRLPPREVS